MNILVHAAFLLVACVLSAQESFGRFFSKLPCTRPFLQEQRTFRFISTCRGGATRTEDPSNEVYSLLARAVQSRLVNENDGSTPELSTIVKAFKSLASAQKAFKGLDGAAHEAYQRTHTSDEVDLSVQGRARRSAARASAAANALGACELCELIDQPELFDLQSPNGTLAGRQVLLNVTDAAKIGDSNVSVLVLYEPSYQGGAGIHHGGIEDMTDEHQHRRRGTHGRLLIVIGDSLSRKLDEKLIRILAQKPKHVRLLQGPEIASVQPSLYQAAGSLLTGVLEPILRAHNTSAIHFAGRSLSGGIASLAATILDGDIPLPSEKSKTEAT